MANERVTENLVRNILTNLGYYTDSADIFVEEQFSQIAEVNRLLKGSSKTGGVGRGNPEFIISSPMFPDFLIIIECKAKPHDHESINHNKPKEYAVDGVIHYSRALSRSYNVVAIAASGQNESELKISTYLFVRNSTLYRPLTNEHGLPITEIISFNDFNRLASFHPDVEKKRHDDLMDYSKTLHEFMRDHAKLTESEKPLLVSGTLIALQNEIFATTYNLHQPEELQDEWLRVIGIEINKAKIPRAKKERMKQPYSSIAVHPELGKATTKYPKGVLNELGRVPKV